MKKQKNLPIYELTIGANPEEGILANSLVNDPANATAFVAFSKEAPVEIELAKDPVKYNVSGPLLIPEQLIFRRDEKRGEYLVRFTRETIEAVLKNFSKNLRFRNITLEHSLPVDSVHLVEIWLTGNKADKAKELGFDVPPGTLMATAHIEDRAIWDAVLDGTFNGFSIEGLFGMKLVEMSAHADQDAQDEKEFLEMMEGEFSDEERLAWIKSKILGE